MSPQGVLTSTDNPVVKRVHSLTRRAGRDKARAFLAEGVVVVRDLLNSKLETEIILVSESALGATGDLQALARERGVTVQTVSDAIGKRLASTETPQGVVAVASLPDPGFERLSEVDLVVVLAGVGDPGNAGTLIRSAAAAGAQAVICALGSVDPYSPKVVRASSGALFSLPVLREVDLDQSLARLREEGLSLVGLDAKASHSIFEVDLARRSALVVGHEADGIPASSVGLLDTVASIPMPGGSDSLNAAVAGSIAIFEAVRQRAHRYPPQDE